ncbi:MAG TPA: autorepressor SdpR family transcription factor [Candidatus Eisenbacteria bacterium]|nr:autorepressor SdpR family transcription factor [Candidatus Eisenbacteria bacterium]
MNQVFRALADPTRRRVLQLLRERPRTAGELAAAFPVSKPTMSAHFSVLQEAGLIAAERNGRTILYRLRMSVLEEALMGFVHSLEGPKRAVARRRRGDVKRRAWEGA